MKMKAVIFLTLIIAPLALTLSGDARAADPMVYGVYRALDMGEPGEVIRKDFFVNIGSKNGVGIGSRLEVFRRAPTYDLVNSQYHSDTTFPIATLKVIHVEGSTAIARLEAMKPLDKTPAISPVTVMAGDLVQLSR